MPELSRPGGSWAVQGCLFGSVALFAILLVLLVILAYRRFQEQTRQPPSPATIGWLQESAVSLPTHSGPSAAPRG